jgi:hypothetical protein
MNTETDTDASRILFINSADTTDSSVVKSITTDYSFIADESIVVPPHHTILLSLHHTQIPYSFYNFQQNRNCQLNFSLTASGATGSTTATEYTITLDEANYNAASLITNIKTQLEAHASWGGGTINIRFNRDTLKYEWNYFNTGGAAGEARLTLRIGTGTNALTNFRNEMGFNDNKYIDADATQDVWFEDNATTFLAGKSDGAGAQATEHTTTPNDRNGYWDGLSSSLGYNIFSVIDVLSSIRSLFIRTNLTSSSVLDSSVGGGFSSILARVPIDVASGGIISIAPSDGAVHKLLLKIKEITVINVKLTDQKNRVIDLNGLDWDLSLQFDFIETPSDLKVPVDKRLQVETKKYEDWKLKQEKAVKKK